MKITIDELARARGWSSGFLAMSRTRPEPVRLFAVCCFVGHAPDGRYPARHDEGGGVCARCGSSIAGVRDLMPWRHGVEAGPISFSSN